MRALVIGGNRFLGKQLVNELLKHGFEVTTLNRGNLRPQYDGPVSQINVDRTQGVAMAAALSGKSFDVVYDMICADPQTAAATIEALRGVTTRVILASSSFVYPYGQHIHEEQFDPGHYTIPGQFAGLGGSELRRLAEAVYVQKSGFKVTIARLPFVLGAEDSTGKLKKLVRKVFLKEDIYIPNKNARFSVITVEDAAKAMAKLGVFFQDGAVNIASEVPVSMGQILKMVEELSYRAVRYTDKGDSDSISLFSLKTDWYVDTNRLRRLDFVAKPPSQWLPALLEQTVHEVNKGF